MEKILTKNGIKHIVYPPTVITIVINTVPVEEYTMCSDETIYKVMYATIAFLLLFTFK